MMVVLHAINRVAPSKYIQLATAVELWASGADDRQRHLAKCTQSRVDPEVRLELALRAANLVRRPRSEAVLERCRPLRGCVSSCVNLGIRATQRMNDLLNHVAARVSPKSIVGLDCSSENSSPNVKSGGTAPQNSQSEETEKLVGGCSPTACSFSSSS